MNVETFINRVIEMAEDSDIRKEFEKGLEVQFTIDKEKAKIIALRPDTTRGHSEDRSLPA